MKIRPVYWKTIEENGEQNETSNATKFRLALVGVFVVVVVVVVATIAAFATIKTVATQRSDNTEPLYDIDLKIGNILGNIQLNCHRNVDGKQAVA